jgi:predicted nucleic acid-binding protein
LIAAAEIGLLDTGVLVALIDRDDDSHESAVSSVGGFRGNLATTEAVLTEALHLLRRTHGGQDACLRFFLRGGATLFPASLHALSRCRELMEEYADLPADYADATIVALSEEVGTRIVFTLDRRGFSTYRDRAGKDFEIRP